MQMRLPAEWEAQDAVLLAWPHAATDWADMLSQAEATYCALVQAIIPFEQVIIIAPDTTLVAKALDQAGIERSRVWLVSADTNDTWTRDYGPITVHVNNTPVLLDFGFNGWGLKFPADKDNQVTRRLKADGVLLAPMNTIGLILEGGSIESDGQGTILTTSHCLLSANRNPQLDKDDLEGALRNLLGAHTIHWLDAGALIGDDTDAHIDTLARLCPNNTIIHITCDDMADPHYESLEEMRRQLEALRTPSGAPYRLLGLPWPTPKYAADGRRLPASYANYLVINDAVIVPTYNDPVDNGALAMVALAFPDRTIVGVDCSTLIEQHGSLHCVTMQLPQGVLA